MLCSSSKQLRRQRLGQLRLSHAGGAQEQEGTDGLGGILDPGLGTDNGVRYLAHRLILAHYSLVQLVVQAQDLGLLSPVSFGHRNARSTGK